MKSLKIAIIGGSLGGLFTGIALREKGHQVDIYERSAGMMEDRGAGLVIQPDIEEFLTKYNLEILQEITVPLSYRKFIRRDGKIEEIPMPQLMTSWNRLYGALIDAFPAEHYHSGKRVVDFSQSQCEVSINFQDGTKVTADYVIGADGIGSVVRNKVLPAAFPTYAGYVAWRGTVNIEEIPKDILNFFFDKFTFYQGINTQILSYFIPNKYSYDSIRLNWVWYETILNNDQLNQLMTANDGRKYEFVMPPNQLPESVISNQKQKAEKVLPTPFANLIHITKTPFVQPIYDLEVSHMVFNKVIVLGDASFVPRPHTASGVSKAAYNAMKLAAAFDIVDQPIENLRMKLKEWETDQLRLGQYLSKMGKQLGDRSNLGYGRHY
ncbi:FAD binding domain-containing protein [Bacillus sp. OTU530]|uniref:FAD binding domain-containing protein n=1 Tax=Bacillus sp. OTU530 TaxID=3043862 RepID=UPI00313BAA40